MELNEEQEEMEALERHEKNATPETEDFAPPLKVREGT
jgi:hypothetical protein